MPAALDLTGQRYGRLIAIKRVTTRRTVTEPRIKWLFRCDCGREVERTVLCVRAGDTSSCGCLRNDSPAIKAAHVNKRLQYGESSFRGLYKNYRNRAAAAGLEFSLTIDDFRLLTSQSCHYCGEAPFQAFISNHQSHGEYIYIGVDRLDNESGYRLNNVVSCCIHCNRAKGKLSSTQFLTLIQKISKHSGLLTFVPTLSEQFAITDKYFRR